MNRIDQLILSKYPNQLNQINVNMGYITIVVIAHVPGMSLLRRYLSRPKIAVSRCRGLLIQLALQIIRRQLKGLPILF